MESYIPIRPNSDLHRRLSARKRLPPAMATPFQGPAKPIRRNRPRSSSFSAISQSLSRLLPSNRPERGGTARPLHGSSRIGDNPSPSKTVAETPSKRGRIGKQEGDGEEMRRTKSWSPRKIDRNAGEIKGEHRQPSTLRKPSPLKRLWEPHMAVRADDRTVNISQHQDVIRSNTRGAFGVGHNRLAGSKSMQPNRAVTSTIESADAQKSLATLRRSQQILEDKKTRREARRSFRESDDFIGVQGINPRTGYPDPSTATTSSAGDVISESIRQRLEEHESIIATASREYKAALERREIEMKRLGMEREIRKREKKERADKKRAHLRARVRKNGRWKIDGNTWSMVTQPSLSPATQSIAGTPIPETSTPPYQSFKTPATFNEITTARSSARTEDYFTPTHALPKTSAKHQTHYAGFASHVPFDQRDPFQDIETTSRKLQQSRWPIELDSLLGNGQATSMQTDNNMTPPFWRKEVGSDILRRRASSSETIIHKVEAIQPSTVDNVDNIGPTVAIPSPSVNPALELTTPGETTIPLSITSPVAGEALFLGMIRGILELRDRPKDETSVTSFQLAAKRKALLLLSSPQSPKDTFRENHIYAMEDFPPVVLKNPISARFPSSTWNEQKPCPSPVSKLTRKVSDREIENQNQGTPTSITTTTGFEGLPHHFDHKNSLECTSEDQVTPQRQILTKSRVPTASFLPKETLNGTPSSVYPRNQADIATSSAHHHPAFSTPTKRPIPRPCQLTLSKLETRKLKITRTSTSTSPQRQSASKQLVAAQIVTHAASTEVTSRLLGREVKERSSSLVTPNMQTKEREKWTGQGRKIFSAGNVDIGDLSGAWEEWKRKPQVPRIRIEQAKELVGPPENGGQDELVVWCTETKKRVRFSNEKPTSGQEQIPQTTLNKKFRGRSSPDKKSQSMRNGVVESSLLRKTYGMLRVVVGAAWYFVSPVFNPRSSLRRRWGRNELTWQDILLIGAAGIFGGGAFLIMVLLARLLGIGLQIVRVCIKVCKVLTQL